MEIETPADAQQHLAALASAMTAPRPRECLLCYVNRMVDGFGCDTTLRWARRWRALCAPRATGLERRLEARGGFCDCEIFLNGWDLRADLQERDDDGGLTWPSERPRCAGAPARSTQPCANWVPYRRPRY